MNKMKQVVLESHGTRVVAWIESKLAKKNKLLEEDNGRRWVVRRVYKLAINEDQLNQDWKVGGLI
jgi:hypothetical protein